MARENQEKSENIIYKKGDFKEQYLEILIKLLEQQTNCLAQANVSLEEDDLLVNFILPDDYYTLAVTKKLSKAERFKIMLNLLDLNSLGEGLVPIWDFDNILVNLNQDILMIERGYVDMLKPDTFEEAENVKNLKSLLVSIYRGSNQGKVVSVSQGKIGNSKMEEAIMACDSSEELRKLILGKLTEEVKISKRDDILINKNKYRSLAVVAVVLGIFSIVLGFAYYRDSVKIIPRKDKIIKAQSDYIINNYDAVISDLKKYSPNDLPDSAQVVLARSYIEVDNLNAQQKDEVLKNISLKTPENVLKYWIYNGRGEFDKSLDMAKNIGDKQLMLYAYSKLYESTKVNTRMSGEKKEKLLSDYKEAITELSKEIQGKSDDK